MPDPSNQASSRDLPISLRAIEWVLRYLKEKGDEAISIRKISNDTEISMRVVKNVLLQLEKFNQVERITEANNVTPKWKISKFGKRVIKEATADNGKLNFPLREEELISDIILPSKNEEISKKISASHQKIVTELNMIQVDLSKILGQIFNINNPSFEDLIGFIIKRLKYLKQRMSNLKEDPTSVLTLKKMGEKQKKLTKDQEKSLKVELFFFNHLILNELKRITEFIVMLSQKIDHSLFTNGFSIAGDIRSEIRILSSLIKQRELINIDSHIMTKEEIGMISKNNITTKLLENLIQFNINREELIKSIEEIVLNLIANLEREERLFKDHNYEITDNIPLFALYQLILDQHPNLNFEIEQLEDIINGLTENGYLPGIKHINTDEGVLKIVQFKSYDITKDETNLISIAFKLEKLNLADVVKITSWQSEKSLDLLNKLTRLGILKYSKSLLHGEQWYVISEKKY